MVTHLSYSDDVVDGGIATAVRGLIAAQQSAGLSPQWLTADSFFPQRRDRDLLALAQASAPRLIHVHGLWRSPTRICHQLARDGLPIVIAPHGMLDSGALAISRHKKQFAWRLWEKRALQAASCLHALCPAEALAIRALLPGAPIAVIPNGVELPRTMDSSVNPLLPSTLWAEVIPLGAPVLLFFGRFHSKKGLEPLLKAWQSVARVAERSGWWLALVGYGDNGSLQRHVQAAQSRGELPQVFVGGPVFGTHKSAVLRDACAFVLPSFSEGLPMAALEAMAHQLPCLLSSACNLPEAFIAGAAMPAEPRPDDLSEALYKLFSLSEVERGHMGAAGRALVDEHYSWSQVAAQTKKLYHWCLCGGEPPAFLQLG